MTHPSPPRGRPSVRARALVACPAVAALVAFALPAAPAQAASPFNCDASAVRASLLGQAAIEPVTANRAQPACADAVGGLTGALPAPLSVSAAVARTITSGPDNRVDQQSALAVGGLADVRIAGLPALPITLPIDTVAAALPTLPAIPVPALLQPLLGTSLSLDIKPALTALLPAGRLPDVELVGVQAAIAYAGARCNAGRAELFSTSSVAGIKVLGQDVVASAPVDQTLNLIDTAQVDPSAIDPIGLLPADAVTTILGTPLLDNVLQTDLKPAIQAALDALPTITIPATLANVKISAGPKTEQNGVITQQALRITATIAGQPIADVIAGEARASAAGVDCTPPAVAAVTPPPPTATELALQCTTRRLVLEDVIERGGRVRLVGVADRKLAGRRVAIRFLATGATAATATIRPDGSFSATAPLPPRYLRATNHARYQAVVGREKSLDLKLRRRMVITGVAVRGGKVTISGRVSRPLTSTPSVITVSRRVSCKRNEVVARITPRRDGTFRATVDAPTGQAAAVYRLGTFVRKTTRNPRRYPTFTLPRAVDLTSSS